MNPLWSVVSLVFGVNLVFCQWANRVSLEGYQEYFHKVMTETIHRMEERQWSSFKLDDYSVAINQQMYKWHVTGNISYTNGFLVSIQKVDINNLQQLTETISVGGVTQTLASVRGTLHLRDVTVGYDILAQLDEGGDHTYTGKYTHTLASFQFSIRKNLHTQEITTTYSSGYLSTGGTGARMIFMPTSNLTEVMSRTYVANRANPSVIAWGSDIQPIILDVATNKIAFPEVCLDCR